MTSVSAHVLIPQLNLLVVGFSNTSSQLKVFRLETSADKGIALRPFVLKKKSSAKTVQLELVTIKGKVFLSCLSGDNKIEVWKVLTGSSGSEDKLMDSLYKRMKKTEKKKNSLKRAMNEDEQIISLDELEKQKLK